MIEIELRPPNHAAIEYEVEFVPREGEKIYITLDHIDELFVVSHVEHHVFRDTTSGKIRSYASVFLDTI